jgi:hypothetical protein
VLAEMKDDTKRAELWKAVGNEEYALHTHIPLFWTRIAFAGNPKVIADYRFPGNLGSFITHHEQIKAAA